MAGWQATPVTLALLVATGVNLLLAGILFRRREVPGATPFVAVALLIALWSFSDAILYGTVAEGPYVFWYTIAIVAATFIAIPTLLFVLEYTGRDEWLSRRRVAALAAVPTLFSAVVIAVPRHELLWQYGPVVRTSPFVIRETTMGSVALAYVLVMYLLLAVALALLVQQVLRTRGPFRRQALLITVAIAVPFATSILWAFELSPIPEVDFTVFAFTISDAAIVLALSRFDLFDLAPVARHTLVSEMDDLLFAVDESGRIADVNPVARRLLDHDGPIIGEPAAAVIPAYETLLDTDESTAVTIDAADGTREFDARYTPIADGRDRSRGALVLLRDVTERRRAERRFQALIENATDLVAVLDSEGRYQYLSPAAESLYGYDPDELHGERAVEYVHPEDRARVAGQFEALDGETDQLSGLEFRVRDGRGNWRCVEAHAQDLRANPAIDGIVVNAREVTERVEYRAELERQNEYLDQFASVVSHDLRNPLNIIDGRAELIRETGDLEHVEHIETATERMEELIDDLLTLAREGEAVDEVEQVSLRQVVSDAWETVATADATLVCETDQTVAADADRLRQAFSNLFRNAVEHGSTGSQNSASSGDAVEHGGQAVTVRVVDTEDGFAVTDDGPGIAADERDQVFEWGHTTEPGGTGYGLAIVDRVVDAHGWTVEVTDSGAGGARFEVAVN